MSSFVWQGHRIIQRVGDDSDELGHVALDASTGKYVLWLKDTGGVYFATSGKPFYMRAEEFTSLEDAIENAPDSPAANIMHMLWLRDGIRRAVRKAIEENWDLISPALDNNASKGAVLDQADMTLKEAPGNILKKVATSLDPVGSIARSATRVVGLLKLIGLI